MHQLQLQQCVVGRFVEHVETAQPKVDYPKEWRVLMVDAEDDPCYPLLETHLEAIFFISMHALGSLFQHSWPLLSEGWWALGISKALKVDEKRFFSMKSIENSTRL